MDREKELKPCPFCGAKVEICNEPENPKHIGKVFHPLKDTNCELECEFYTKKWWNTRSPAPSKEGLTTADVVSLHANTAWYRGECCSGYPNCIHKPTPPVDELKPYPEMPSEKWDKKAPPVEVNELVEALKSLVNNQRGMLSAYGEEFRPIIGNTNLAVAEHWLEHAEEALKKYNLIYNQKRTG